MPAGDDLRQVFGVGWIGLTAKVKFGVISDQLVQIFKVCPIPGLF